LVPQSFRSDWGRIRHRAGTFSRST